MRFWDSSALVPLLASEPATQAMLAAVETDPDMLVWWGSPVECASAIARREREGLLAPAAASGALGRLRALGSSWNEVQATRSVGANATRALRIHPLAAAAALQLAAALVAAEGQPETLEFMCLDERLGYAAEREGFAVLGIGPPGAG